MLTTFASAARRLLRHGPGRQSAALWPNLTTERHAGAVHADGRRRVELADPGHAPATRRTSSSRSSRSWRGPDEPYAGELPNDDAQSLVFDDSILFDRDKFSGLDRVEGGTRLNYGIRYIGTFTNNIVLEGLFGQSRMLAGQNSFAVKDIADVGAYSGPGDGRLRLCRPRHRSARRPRRSRPAGPVRRGDLRRPARRDRGEPDHWRG